MEMDEDQNDNDTNASVSSSSYGSPTGGDWSSDDSDDLDVDDDEEEEEEENTFYVPDCGDEDTDADYAVSPVRGGAENSVSSSNFHLATQPKSQQSEIKMRSSKKKKRSISPKQDPQENQNPKPKRRKVSLSPAPKTKAKPKSSPAAASRARKAPSTTSKVQEVIELDDDDEDHYSSGGDPGQIVQVQATKGDKTPTKPKTKSMPPKKKQGPQNNTERTNASKTPESLTGENNVVPASSKKLVEPEKMNSNDSADHPSVGDPAKQKQAPSAKPQTTVEKPQKSKKKKRSFTDRLLIHMFLSGRPHSVKELAKFMDSNETSISFTFLALLDKQWVVKKEFTSKGGRVKELFWANQRCKSHELQGILNFASARDVQAAKSELVGLEREGENMEKVISQLTTGPTNAELNEQLSSLEEDVKDLNSKVAAAKSRIQAARQTATGGKKGGLQNNQKRLKQNVNKMRDLWKKRRDTCMDFVDLVADGMEKRNKDVIQMLEIATDEMEGVKLPPKHVIE